MLHKRAAQRADGTGWQYVLGKRDGGAPIGYCPDHAPHPTEAEARDCYARYVREQTICLDNSMCSWTSCAARVDGSRCPNPTRSIATYGDDGYGLVALCPEHMTVEHVIATEQLDRPAGDAWIS